MQEKLSLPTKTGIFTIVFATIGFILIGAANGVLGDLGTTVFHWFWGMITQLPAINPWFWMTIVLILTATLVCTVIAWIINSYNLNKTHQVLELDYQVLRLLPNLISAADLENEMRRLAHKMLELATDLFDGYVHRASLFLPDADKKHLKMWDGYQMPEDSIRRTVFDIEIGKIDSKRGIAGEVFLDGQFHVAHLKREKDEWKSDKEEYIFFEKRTFMPYASCVCAPISISTDIKDRLGVICFDSSSETIFDSAESKNSELQKRLALVAGRFAATLIFYEELKKPLQSHQMHTPHPSRKQQNRSTQTQP